MQVLCQEQDAKQKYKLAIRQVAECKQQSQELTKVMDKLCADHKWIPNCG